MTLLPPRLASLLATSLALAAALAGCSDTPAAEGPEQVSVITDPRDLLNGTAPGSHIHDYWGGRDRAVVLDQESQGRSTCTGCDEGMTFASARPDEGAIVPQGTRWVNGTFTLQSDGQDQYDALELWVKTAQDVEPELAGPLQPGVPFFIESAQERNDPPHYVLSLWVFEVRAVGGDEIHVGGTYRWSIEAVRGLPLVPYPPHPDRWDGAQQLDLLADSGGTQLTYVLQDPAGGTSTSCYNGCPGRHVLPSGTVVPYDSGRVEATLTIQGGLPAGVGLWFHGADTWQEAKAEGTMAAPGRTTYVIPIEGSMADSPYAPQSLWEFQVWLDQPQPQVQAWSGDYTLEVRAFRA